MAKAALRVLTAFLIGLAFLLTIASDSTAGKRGTASGGASKAGHITAARDSSDDRGDARGGINKVGHIVIVMQENHSFDAYYGVLGLVPGGVYHNGGGSCPADDHQCVDGLSCTRDASGNYTCSNSNAHLDGTIVNSFHTTDYCPGPDLSHTWAGTHYEVNFNNPNAALSIGSSTPMDGFAALNDSVYQNGALAIGFYNEQDIPFYYDLAQKFAISDSYFSSVLGPTTPNRLYIMAGTSFGHTANEQDEGVPLGPFQPINGSIFDLLDAHNVSWADYYVNIAEARAFRDASSPNLKPLGQFPIDVQNGTLPQVSIVEGFFPYWSEHPPFDIRTGQQLVAAIVQILRNSPNWNDTVLFFTYDEHGGFYDHVSPAAAKQGGALSPDGLSPGQCADLSNPPTSLIPGNGALCTVAQTELTSFCPGFTATGDYPSDCANLNQLGVRVPLMVISPFAKAGYVSHTVADHTSILRFIEERFVGGASLSARDASAYDLMDMFDFVNSPSQRVEIQSELAATPTAQDGNGSCAFEF